MGHGTGIYRDHDETLRRRLDEARQRCSEALRSPEMRALARIYCRRRARLVAGLSGAVAGAAMLIAGVARFGDLVRPCQVIALWVLSLALPAGVYLGARLWSHLRLRSWRRGLLASTGSAERDLERLAAATPLGTLRARAHRFAVASIALPLMAIALVGPLTLHAPFAILGDNLRTFATWIALSSAIVGHAHLVLAGLSARYAVQLGRDPHMTGGAGRALGWTVLASAIPGVVFLALPPILTAITGAVLVFAGFAWARRTMLRESAVVVRMAA